jgi:hypothetical protein
VSALWLGPALFAMIDAIAQRRLRGEPPATARELIWQGGDWFLYAFITPAVFWLANRWPIVRPRLARRTLLHLGLALTFCVAWAVGGKLLQAGLAWLFDRETFLATVAAEGPGLTERLARDVASWIFVTLPFGVVVYSSMAGLAHAFRYFDEVRQRESQLAEARLAALQARLNPHFLFNTLNTIAVRARDGERDGTVRIVEQLAEVLRRTLSRQQTPEVSLAEELELVRLYLGIEAARFSDRLAPHFAIDPATLSTAVPSFAVQHLVENAVRHGIARRSGAGLVEVRSERRGDMVVVSVRDEVVAEGHGLANTRERLRVLHGARASLDLVRGPSGGAVATLVVPWREMPRSEEAAPGGRGGDA